MPRIAQVVCLLPLVTPVLIAAPVAAQYDERTHIDTESLEAVYWWPAKKAYLFEVAWHKYDGPFEGLVEVPRSKGSSGTAVRILKRGWKKPKSVEKALGADWKGLDALGTELTTIGRYEKAKLDFIDGKDVVIIGDARIPLPEHFELGSPNALFLGADGDLVVLYEQATQNASHGMVSILQLSPLIMGRFASASGRNDLGFGAYKKKDWKEAARQFRLALLFDPKHKHANFNLACTLGLSGGSFEQIKAPLEAVLAQDALRAKYLGKIQKDSDLTSYRAAPEFGAWFAAWQKK